MGCANSKNQDSEREEGAVTKSKADAAERKRRYSQSPEDATFKPTGASEKDLRRFYEWKKIDRLGACVMPFVLYCRAQCFVVAALASLAPPPPPPPS